MGKTQFALVPEFAQCLPTTQTHPETDSITGTNLYARNAVGPQAGNNEQDSSLLPRRW